jgi:hypothetical protein
MSKASLAIGRPEADSANALFVKAKAKLAQVQELFD